MIEFLIPILCPKCKLKTALQRSFGKKGHCFNCNHDWPLRWKGSQQFSTNVRLQYV